MGKIKGKKRKIPNKSPIVKPKTRKDIRKEKRQMKKLKKQEYFSKGRSGDVGKYVRAPEPDSEEDENAADDIAKPKQVKKSNKSSDNNIILQENLGAKKREDKLKTEMKEKRNNQLLKANEEEDKIINKLEKQLKLKKKSGIAKSFAEDGLGYLLEVCDEKTMSAAVTAEKHLADTGSGSDFEEDFAIATGRTDLIRKEKISNSSDDAEESENNDDVEEYSGNSDDKSYEYPDVDLEEVEEIEFGCGSDVDDDVEMADEGINEEVFDEEEEETEGEVFDEEEEETDEEDSFDKEDIPYSGVCGFPDDTFNPGNLTPVKEETDQELNTYMNNLEIPSKHEELSNDNVTKKGKHKVDSDEEHVLELNSDNEKMFDSGSEENEDARPSVEDLDTEDDELESSENSNDSFFESDESECENPECFSDEDNDEKDHIIVNGKIINVYGRQIPDNVEPDFVRCPKLDQLLANLSDSETEFSPKSNSLNSAFKPDDDSKSVTRKRKLKETEAIEVKNKKSKTDPKIKSISLPDNNTDKKPMKPNTSEKHKKSNNKVQKDIDSESHEEDDDSDFPFDSDESHDEKDEDIEPKKLKINEDGSWEDIYGRKRDKDGNVISETTGKYVPPHMRAKASEEDSAETLQLKRQIKGLLNKVAGSNMHWTSSQMESIYSSNSRNAVNSAFCSLWLSALVQPTVTPDRMAAEHAMLVTALHANVGSEVGAHFLQTVVKKLDDMTTNIKQHLESKELDNLVLAISQLYNFKIFQASLLYEILTRLLEELSEKSIECTLVALRNVGGSLRKEDPAALKGFIHTMQERAVNFKHKAGDGSRVKFLLDVLMAIKNNNMNKIPNYDPSYAEELKKALKGIIRRGNYVVPLNIKLEDLLKADEKGKWWVVGSAWEGSSRQNSEQDNSGSKESNKDDNQAFLMELAKKQRINTELRRSIFCIIMSAEDYMDCFEKLQQLGLKNQQEKEIIHVLLSCCLQEKVYNPYYAVLAQKFCDYDRKFQLSIQFSVWDKLKEIDTCSTVQIANLAQFLTHLFNEKGLPISILKVVQFADITKCTLRLMRQILLAILLQKNCQTCLEVFQRVAVSPKLHMFREGLKLFISHFLLKNSDKKEILSEEQMNLLKERAAAVDKTLSSDSKLQF